MFAVSKVTIIVRMLSFSIDAAPQSFWHSFVALSMIRCSKSAKKFTVWCVRWLLLLWKPHSWFSASLKTFYRSHWRIEQVISVPKIISEHCELVKLCDINCSGLVFFRHTV